jgi:hypothetical protein
MASDKNDKVLSVRLSAKAAKELEDISEYWGIPVSTLGRSFILTCLYGLRSGIPTWIKREQPKSEVAAITATKAKPSGKQKVSEIEKDYYENGMPRKDRKGNIIPEETWNLIKKHRNYLCPCGSGKKYKQCHGKKECP